MGRIELIGSGKGRRGVSRTHALLTHRETAEILFARGVLSAPQESQVRFWERRAFEKLRDGLADLEAELLDDEGRARLPIVEVY